MQIKNKSIMDTLVFLMLLSIFMLSNTVYSLKLGGSLNKILIYINLLLTITCGIYAIFIFYIEKINIIKIIKIEGVFIILSLIVFLYHTVVNGLALQATLRMLVLPIFLFLVFFIYYKWNDINFIMRTFRKITVFFAVASLIFHFIYIFFTNSLFINISIDWGRIKSIGGNSPFYFVAQQPIVFLGKLLPRNTGIFSEAPMYSLVLTLALMSYLLIERKKFILDFTSIILMITILTTTSTTGVISVLMLYLFMNISKTSNNYIAMFISILVITPIVIYGGYNIISAKFAQGTASTSVRLDDIHAGYISWLEKPIMGHGFQNSILAIQSKMAIGRIINLQGNSGFSSGIFSSLNEIGLVGTIIYVLIPLIVYSLLGKLRFIFVIIFFFILINTIFFGSYIYMLFICMMIIEFYTSYR